MQLNSRTRRTCSSRALTAPAVAAAGQQHQTQHRNQHRIPHLTQRRCLHQTQRSNQHLVPAQAQPWLRLAQAQVLVPLLVLVLALLWGLVRAQVRARGLALLLALARALPLLALPLLWELAQALP